MVDLGAYQLDANIREMKYSANNGRLHHWAATPISVTQWFPAAARPGEGVQS